MHHGLLVAALVVAQRLLAACVAEYLAFEQCLSDTRHIAVTEDAPTTGEEGVLDTVTLDVLLLEESDQCLGHGQPVVMSCSCAGREAAGRCPGRPRVANPCMGRVVADQPSALVSPARPSR